MSVALDAWRSAWRPQDRRSVCEWAGESIKIPNSARTGGQFSADETPWLREPIDFPIANRIREQVVIAPTGAGKTTLFDARIPHHIVEDPGSILLGMQTDPDADGHWRDRLEPILQSVPAVREMIAALPRNRKGTGRLEFPHLTLNCVGSNKSNFQRVSRRFVYLDEVWLIKHGLVDEARKRTHDRWNALITLVSQGGWESIETEQGTIDTELHAAWIRTDQRVWHWCCPECGLVQPFRWRQMRWDGPKDGETFDETEAYQSARMECANIAEGKCGEIFADSPQNRRALAMSGRYVVTHPRHLMGHHGWTCNALTLFYIPWGTLVVEWLRACHLWKTRKDDTLLRIFRQKRKAENYRAQEIAPDVVLTTSDYELQSYAEGQRWDGELHRIMTIDRQQNHYWTVIRAWKPNGDSRLLYANRVNTKEGLRELQGIYQVKDRLVFQDAQYQKGEVYRECAEFGWNALHGDEADRGYLHKRKGKPSVRKAYSGLESAQASNGKFLRYAYWSNLLVKDELMAIRSGQRGEWQLPRDTPEWYKKQINSEVKKSIFSKDRRPVDRYVPVKQGIDNHIWDCECMQTVVAMMLGLLPEVELPSEESAAA